MCCGDKNEFKRDEINGECPVCGEPTVDGEAFEQCGWSQEECEHCGWSPCDQSC